jgi:hypothetical protein
MTRAGWSPQRGHRRAAGSRARPRTEQVAVGHRHAEHLADDRDREDVAEVGDHVELPALGSLVEDLVDDGLHARSQLLDGAGRERLADELAQPGVVRRVDEQQHVGVHRAHALAHVALLGRLGQRCVRRVAAPARVAQHRLAVVEAGEDDRGGLEPGKNRCSARMRS